MAEQTYIKQLYEDSVSKSAIRRRTKLNYRLCEEAGYTGGYSSVKHYVRKKRFVLRQEPAGCLPLAHSKAFAQMDFGKFQYYDAYETEHKAYELVMPFTYSDKAYAQVFPSQNLMP